MLLPRIDGLQASAELVCLFIKMQRELEATRAALEATRTCLEATHASNAAHALVLMKGDNFSRISM